MTDILNSLAIILVVFAWHLAKRRWSNIPTGPLWLRAIISLFILSHSLYSVNSYISETNVIGWYEAFLCVNIVMLLIAISLLIVCMLMTINRSFKIGLIEQHPESSIKGENK